MLEQQGLSAAMESFPSPSHTLEKGGHRAGEAADYGALCFVLTPMLHQSLGLSC